MKKIILSTLFFMLSLSQGYAQKDSILIDSKGNYYASKVTTSVSTGKSFTDAKGNLYEVFKSSKGRLFVNKVSKKTNKPYKFYLN